MNSLLKILGLPAIINLNETVRRAPGYGVRRTGKLNMALHKILAFFYSVTVVLASIVLLIYATSALTASPLRVVVIDTGLDLKDERFSNVLCPTGHKDFTKNGINDTEGHGTHITGIIKQFAGNSNYCLIIYKYYDRYAYPNNNNIRLAKAIKEAMRIGADIVNISSMGENFINDEYNAIAEHPNTLVIGAAGNYGENKRGFPGCYELPNARCVGALGHDGNRLKSSNYGIWVDAWQPGEDVYSTLPNNHYGYMSGTSQATATETGLEIKRRQ